MQSQSFDGQPWSSRCGSSMLAEGLDIIVVMFVHLYSTVCSGGTPGG
jgi:hypothetical protein